MQHATNVTLAIIFCLVSWRGLLVQAGVGSPVIIGILGSQLWGRLNGTSPPGSRCPQAPEWYTIWVNLTGLLPWNENCTMKSMMLYYNSTSGQYGNYAGLETKVPGFGSTGSVETLDPYGFIQYFHTLVEHFVSLGYERGKTIRAAPYDWRYSADQLIKQGYYDNLQSLIEDTYALAGNKPVTLVAHSLGGPTSLFFLTTVVDQVWKDTYIKAYVTLSGAWHGAAKVAMAFVSGDNEGVFIMSEAQSRSIDRSYLSAAWLLPYPSDTWTKGDILVVNDNRSYSAWDYYDLFNDISYPQGYAMFEQVFNLTGSLPPPGVPTYCYYGADVKTPLQFIYKGKDFPNMQPTIVYGLGDGTVNDKSLASCERWQQQQTQPVFLKAFSGLDHLAMVENYDVIKAIEDIVASF